MYRFLLSRQWVLLTLVSLLLIPVMVRLGCWQLHRHEAKTAHNRQIEKALSAPAVPVGDLTSPGHVVPDADRYRPVKVTGRYDPAHEVVVRQRTGNEDRIGFHVLTPLVDQDGTVTLVNRGWVPPGEDLTGYPEVPKAPTGRVTVTGLLLPDETTENSGIKDRSGLPDRQVMLINGEKLGLDRPVRGGYVQLTETAPTPSGEQPEPLPEPDHDSIGPHLAYAWNWWLLAAGVPVGWVVLFRRERQDQLSRRATGGAPSPAAPDRATADTSDATPAATGSPGADGPAADGTSADCPPPVDARSDGPGDVGTGDVGTGDARSAAAPGGGELSEGRDGARPATPRHH